MAKNIITVKAPTDSHVVISRLSGDHSILPDWQIETLKGFLELHILRALKDTFKQYVTFDWRYPKNWRDILSFGTDIELVVFPNEEHDSEIVKARLLGRIQVQIIRENIWSATKN